MLVSKGREDYRWSRLGTIQCDGCANKLLVWQAWNEDRKVLIEDTTGSTKIYFIVDVREEEPVCPYCATSIEWDVEQLLDEEGD